MVQYAKRKIIDQWWALKFVTREDNSVQVLGHWAVSTEDGNGPFPDFEETTRTFRLEEDGARFVNRVWLHDTAAGQTSLVGIPTGSKVFVVANPQHVFSYKER